MAKAVADVNKELQGGFTSNDADSEYPSSFHTNQSANDLG